MPPLPVTCAAQAGARAKATFSHRVMGIPLSHSRGSQVWEAACTRWSFPPPQALRPPWARPKVARHPEGERPSDTPGHRGAQGPVHPADLQASGGQGSLTSRLWSGQRGSVQTGQRSPRTFQVPIPGLSCQLGGRQGLLAQGAVLQGRAPQGLGDWKRRVPAGFTLHPRLCPRLGCGLLGGQQVAEPVPSGTHPSGTCPCRPSPAWWP